MEDLIERRVKRLSSLLEKGVNPFAETEFDRTATAAEVNERFSKLKPGEETSKVERVPGRAMSIRLHGGLAFVDIADHTGELQLVVRKDSSPEAFKLVEKHLDRGDIVGATGTAIKTKRGQVSLLVSDLRLLSKALRPIPNEWYGLKDTEVRYRQRYLDMIMNPQVRKRFELVSRLVNGMRSYLLDRGFFEVFTPILQPIYGGAFAKPFKTHHNYLKQDMFLRIAPELYLKRLIVGGFDAVFEVAPCFRNEAVDSTHNPEFIQIEGYKAYINYEGVMELVEGMVAEGVKAAAGTTKVKFQGRTIDFKPPWKRVRMEDALRKEGITDLSDDALMEEAGKRGIDVVRPGDAMEELFSELCQPKLVQPTFVVDFPADISPLAKKFPDNPRMAQRFEAYVAGMEIGNAFSELNNPVEQYLRFREEEKLRKKKVEEYMPMDRDYIRALEYGLPPTGGFGVGIARVASVVLDAPSIKEILPFPAMAGIERIKTVAEMFPSLARKFEE